ncbi:SH3 domain-containing protein [Okeania sp.]|uniref:SH3 domain-containing protein n=1 Tax=Okeania sp. TaxID=3100323 RepID=UPI002B4B57C6|nr:SH3 domain-containing protein [Okeania sp.]MEB3341700.1 SH3 domain-containing protein [Okeania sp.]
MKRMITWTKSAAMSTLLSIAAVSSISLSSIAAGSSAKTLIVDESVTTVPTQTQGEEQLAHTYHGKCRRVATRYKNLRVRTHPWGKIVGRLHRGTRVRVIAYHGDWAKISHPCYGYVSAHYLRHC